MTCKKCTKKTPERQFPLIQKGQFSKFSPCYQPCWHLKETLNQTNYWHAQKSPGYGTGLAYTRH